MGSSTHRNGLSYNHTSQDNEEFPFQKWCFWSELCTVRHNIHCHENIQKQHNRMWLCYKNVAMFPAKHEGKQTKLCYDNVILLDNLNLFCEKLRLYFHLYYFMPCSTGTNPCLPPHPHMLCYNNLKVILIFYFDLFYAVSFYIAM